MSEYMSIHEYVIIISIVQRGSHEVKFYKIGLGVCRRQDSSSSDVIQDFAPSDYEFKSSRSSVEVGQWPVASFRQAHRPCTGRVVPDKGKVEGIGFGSVSQHFLDCYASQAWPVLKQRLPPEITLQDMQYITAELKVRVLQSAVEDPKSFITWISQQASPVAIKFALARLRPQLEKHLPPGEMHEGRGCFKL